MKHLIQAIAISGAIAFPAYAQLGTPAEEMTCEEFIGLGADEQQAALLNWKRHLLTWAQPPMSGQRRE